MKHITTCAGIGDICWLFMKLINQPDKIDFVIPGGTPRRAHQLETLLPQVINSISFKDGLSYNEIKRKGYRGEWGKAPMKMALECNTWLERGRRIEGFLPDLKTSYVLPWVTSDDDKTTANKILTDLPCIGIYTSKYDMPASWKSWGIKEWQELIALIGPDYKFVFIGAEWDQGISQPIMAAMAPGSYINTIGQPLPVVIEILKRLDCFIGFPSGLSILNETLAAKQTVMFYPPHLEKMQNAWADPARIESGEYKGLQWCEPSVVYNWLKSRL